LQERRLCPDLLTVTVTGVLKEAIRQKSEH
jgi:hypothetical protein